MYKAIFYTDAHEHAPVKDLIDSLNKTAKNNKQDKTKLKQIVSHIDFLENYGTGIGTGISEHIQGKIWQIRPGNVRILFFHWKDDKFILLHYFEKKTRKTPKKEIERAIKEMNDWIRRYGH